MEKELIVKALFFIIDNLRNRGVWGGRHTAIHNLAKGMPSWLTENKEGRKAINNAIKIGLNNRFLIMKKSTQELHFSLNPHNAEKISNFLIKVENFIRDETNQQLFKEICNYLNLKKLNYNGGTS